MVYLFVVLHRFQHCTGHITTSSWKHRGNQYTNSSSGFCTVNCRPTPGRYQLSHEAMLGTEPWPQRRVLPLCPPPPPPHGKVSNLKAFHYVLLRVLRSDLGGATVEEWDEMHSLRCSEKDTKGKMLKLKFRCRKT